MKVPLPTIARPAGRELVELGATDPLLARGNGPHLWVCGACSRVLADGARRDQLGGVVVACRCGAYVETAPLPPSGES